MTWGAISSAIEIYRRQDYFDSTYFWGSIFHIVSAFIVLPLISRSIWLYKRRLTESIQKK